MRKSAGGIASWCLFDWAMSAFNTVIGTFVFAVYFARGIWGDEVAGSAVWANALAVAGLCIAILSPVIGAVADRSGRLKPWLALFVLMTVLPTAALFWAEPNRDFALYALICMVVATIGFELSGVVYNAQLSLAAPPRMIGRVSGWGWGLGYFGGLACLALCLVALVQPETPWFGIGTEGAENIRATAVVVAVWFALFSLPLFVFTPDRASGGAPIRRAVSEGLGTLWRTLKSLRRQGNLVRFLLASALYRDGLATLFAVGGLYAAGTFGMSFEEILIFAIGLNVTAGLGAFAFAFLDDAKGSRLVVLLSLAGLIALGLPILLVEDKSWFMGLALALGLFVGPAQAASRSLMARLSPAGEETEYFGLYALTGKAAAVTGPLFFAWATLTFDSQRAGMATILVLLAAGMALLFRVSLPKAAAADRA